MIPCKKLWYFVKRYLALLEENHIGYFIKQLENYSLQKISGIM